MNSTVLEFTVAFVFKDAPAEPEAVEEFEVPTVVGALALMSVTKEEP